MGLTMNYQGLQNKYGSVKKKNKDKPVKTKKKSKKKNKKIPTYEELLKSPKWLKKRKYILEKYGNICSICKSTSNLQVHHLYYEKDSNGKWKNPWNYPDDAFVVLCSKCHKEIHDK